MANKRIRVSDDAGATFYTLPGNTGEKREELANVNDTIFGADYDSSNNTLAQWQVTANGFFKGVAGYNALVKGAGTPTAMSDEATTLVTGKTYRITAPAKRVLDLGSTITVADNAVDKTAEVESIDYLAGLITFKGTYTVTGPVTVSGGYIPLVVIAKARSFNLTQTAGEVDVSTYADAQASGGYRVFDRGLKTASLELGSIYETASIWPAILRDRGIVYVEVDLDVTQSQKTVFRGFFKVGGHTQGGNQGDTESETVPLTLYAPDGDLIVQPFGWYIDPSSNLNIAVKKTLMAWISADIIKIEYLPDGTNGVRGDAVVTECSIANSVDGQNEFSFTFRGRSEPVPVP